MGQYLLFSGNCKEALNVYENAFQTKVLELQLYKDMPVNPDFPLNEEDLELVLHSVIKTADLELMCADSKDPITIGTNMYIAITTQDSDLVTNAWNVLKEGGTINMELQPSFFAKLHGSLQDRFGINWMFTVMNI